MSTPEQPGGSARDLSASGSSTGGQTPTSEPRGGQSSYDAAGNVRDRLKNSGPQSSGGDTRGSGLHPGDDFQQSYSREQLYEGGRDEQQLSQSQDPEPVDLQEPRREDLDPAAAKAAERKVALLFLLSFVGVVGFFAVYWAWDFTYAIQRYNFLYTPLLGVTMALALGGIGAGAVLWAKTLMSDEEAVQERHPFGSDPEERAATAKALRQGLNETQLPRRSLLRNTLLLGGGSLALLPVPLLFSFGSWRHKEQALSTTAWATGTRLITETGEPVSPNDLEVGGVATVFPDVPGGTRMADSVALLIRMEPTALDLSPAAAAGTYNGYIVYSAVCTHLGCPVKLYEEQTHHLLCPCHQSTFEADKGAHVIFGPAARPLPQLAIMVDGEGYFRAKAPFDQPIGPSFWERHP